MRLPRVHGLTMKAALVLGFGVTLGLWLLAAADLADLYASTQRQALVWLGLASLLSLGIALVAMLYSQRLEGSLRRQRSLDVQHTGELQRLSAKLVAAHEEERRTIARELHDELGQVLTAIKMELAVAERKVEATGTPKGLLADAQAITDSALGTVRNLTHLLHPPMLDDLGLSAAIEWQVRGFSKRHGLRVDFQHAETSERLRPEVEAAAYRIVQEGLTNVVRHAQATEVRLDLQRLHGSVRIGLEDNGIGFNPEVAMQQSAVRGLGLIGIRERASELLGSFRIESAPGRGTRLTIDLPAHPRAGVDETESAGALDG